MGVKGFNCVAHKSRCHRESAKSFNTIHIETLDGLKRLYIDGNIQLWSTVMNEQKTVLEDLLSTLEWSEETENSNNELIDCAIFTAIKLLARQIFNILDMFTYYNIALDECVVVFDGKTPRLKKYTQEQRKKKEAFLTKKIKAFIPYFNDLELYNNHIKIRAERLIQGEAEMEMILSSQSNNDYNFYMTTDTDAFLIGYGRKGYIFRDKIFYDLTVMNDTLKIPIVLFRFICLTLGNDYATSCFTQSMVNTFFDIFNIIFCNDTDANTQYNDVTFKTKFKPIFDTYTYVTVIDSEFVLLLIYNLLYVLSFYNKLYGDKMHNCRCKLLSNNNINGEYIDQLVWNLNYLQFGSRYDLFNKDMIYVEDISTIGLFEYVVLKYDNIEFGNIRFKDYLNAFYDRKTSFALFYNDD